MRFRVTEAERRWITAAAGLAGKSPSDWLRELTARERARLDAATVRYEAAKIALPPSMTPTPPPKKR